MSCVIYGDLVCDGELWISVFCSFSGPFPSVLWELVMISSVLSSYSFCLTSFLAKGGKLGYKDFCQSTVLDMPESVGTKGQIDWHCGKHSRYHTWSAAWQGRGVPRLGELSEHEEARTSQH